MLTSEEGLRVTLYDTDYRLSPEMFMCGQLFPGIASTYAYTHRYIYILHNLKVSLLKYSQGDQRDKVGKNACSQV